MKRERLFFDIETSFNIGWFWRPGKQVVRSEQIIHERAIICICWKWEGSEKVHHLTWDKKQNDKKMLEAFMKEVNKADEIIAHNGDNFDIRWLRARCLKHEIPMFPTFRTIDTLKLSRSGFNFNSNSLNYIAKFLGVGQKMETGGIKLWEDIIFRKDKKAMQKMVDYCKQDVVVLERVYDKLKNYTVHNMHYGVKAGGEKFTCPECGTHDVRHNKTYTTRTGTVKRHMRCNNPECGRSYTISNKAYQDFISFRIKNGIS